MQKLRKPMTACLADNTHITALKGWQRQTTHQYSAVTCLGSTSCSNSNQYEDQRKHRQLITSTSSNVIHATRLPSSLQFDTGAILSTKTVVGSDDFCYSFGHLERQQPPSNSILVTKGSPWVIDLKDMPPLLPIVVHNTLRAVGT